MSTLRAGCAHLKRLLWLDALANSSEDIGDLLPALSGASAEAKRERVPPTPIECGGGRAFSPWRHTACSSALVPARASSRRWRAELRSVALSERPLVCSPLQAIVCSRLSAAIESQKPCGRRHLVLRGAGSECARPGDHGTEPESSEASAAGGSGRLAPGSSAAGASPPLPPPVGAAAPLAEEEAAALGIAALARDALGRELELGDPAAQTSDSSADFQSIAAPGAQTSDSSVTASDETDAETTLRTLLIEQAVALGSATFLQAWTSQQGVSESLSFATFATCVEAAAEHLAERGVAAADRVAILSHPSLTFFVHAFAIIAMGGVSVLLNWRQPPPTLAIMVADSGCAFLVSSDAFSAQVAPLLASAIVRARVCSRVRSGPLGRRARCRTAAN
jgi:hypothetical protein